MNDARARKIAANFTYNSHFRVRPFNQGLLVRYHHNTCYFVRESCFWAFVYKAAGIDASAIH